MTKPRILFVSCILLLPIVCGCAVSDMLFSLFGRGYSGGGMHRSEKKSDYDRVVDESKRHGTFRSTDHQSFAPWNE